MKTIVVSAVNLNVGGTLKILNECLKHLSGLNQNSEYRIVALVYDKTLCQYPNIEYIETKWPKKRWINRLWYEYVSMKKISVSLSPVDLWFSLHDTSPTVKVKKQAVYCHNSFFAYKWKMKDLLFAPKIALFAMFTRYIYKKNINKNRYLVVQQNWFKKSMSEMFDLPLNKIIIFPPNQPHLKSTIKESDLETKNSNVKSFVFPAAPDSHKNFEAILKAAEILEKDHLGNSFEVVLTISGEENAYTKWLRKKWNHLTCVRFVGYLSIRDLYRYYNGAEALIYPSKVESWGLPISEFLEFDKPMLLADLPYAYEAASGANKVAYFEPNNAIKLANMMASIINGDTSFLKKQGEQKLEDPVVYNWNDLFSLLLK